MDAPGGHTHQRPASWVRGNVWRELLDERQDILEQKSTIPSPYNTLIISILHLC